MKETSRMSCSRALHGSRPSTFNSPSYGVRPRIALSAVVLPAPLGPMSPRIRPSSIRKLTPSSAMVVPKALRRLRASMTVMASALLLVLGGIRLGGFRRCGICRRPAGRPVQEFSRFQPERLNGCVDPGPVFTKKLLAFALQQQTACAVIDEHAEAASALD